jgi:DNA primase
MSLPPGFLDELRTRTTLSQVVGAKVTWDSRKSNMAKGDFWAPCPFHQEKTASFHVDDRKGFYYCFGCHAKGDGVSFLRETGNMGFMEAIEVLAREAGMTMPARDPKAAEVADRRTELAEVMESAVRYFRLQLRSSAGAAARDYLAGRRLSEAAQDRFEIGFAPDSRQGLFAALTAKGIAPDLLIDAGLCAAPDDGGAPYDRFRGRIMFPIRDARGRCIGFGGRAMDPNARAKYYNSPETILFDKGRSLYNHGQAREAAAKGQPLIVAEGYMDVIALVEAGFTGAVAPLGTAVTEDQLRMLWRIHPEPIVALDGDTAGIRAAMRLVDLALPMLEAGQSLRFVILPEGLDPDDLIKQRGREAMQDLIEDPIPTVKLLWRRETEGQNFDSPERKASLRKRLREAISTIKDHDIRRYYADALKHFEWELFRPQNWVPSFKGAASKALTTSSARSSRLAGKGGDRAVEYIRETAIIYLCIRHQDIVAAFEAALEQLELIEDEYAPMLQVILANYDVVSPDILLSKLGEIVGSNRVETLMNSPHIRVLPTYRHPNDPELALETLAEQLAKLSTERGLRKEIEEAEEAMGGLVDEGLTWRLAQAAEARHRAEKADLEDADVALGDRAALSAHLQDLINAEIWVKKKR